MLHLITGNPGAKKSAFVVSKLDKIETENKVNLVKNIQLYNDNLPIIEKWKNDFTYYEYEVGSGDELRTEIEVLPDDYFAMFSQEFDDLRPDDYFLRVVRFNEICERVNEREGIQGFKGLLPVRTIYANIKALKIDYVRALKTDWRDCPDGSIIVIDEVQLIKPYDNLKDRNNEMIQELTIHRHRGFDFFFITQHPSLLHPTAKILIGMHWHLTVPFGWRTKVYQWGSTRDYPNTLINKINCEKKFDFNPPARIFKLYKSTTINTHQKRFPWKPAIFLTMFVGACLFLMITQLTKVNNSTLVNHDKKLVASVPTSAPSSAPSVAVSSSAPAPASAPLPSIPSPPDLAQVQLAQYQQKLREMPANVIAFGDNCTAYNVDGLPLEMSLSECKRYAHGKKPVLKVFGNSQNNVMPVSQPVAPVASVPSV